jgi:hypothetical protein
MTEINRMPCIGDNRELTQESKLIAATDMPLGKHTVCALRQNESCAINSAAVEQKGCVSPIGYW